MSSTDNFYHAFRGNFKSLLSWEQLDIFWGVVRARADAGWHLYAIGMPPPAHPSLAHDVVKFITEVDVLLHNDHREDYCGIVYADNAEAPTFIKIFDPNYLGVSCGFNHNPPLPGWIMSLIPPQSLESQCPLPASREHWWQTLWV